MATLRIEDGIYDSEKTKIYQVMLENNYAGIEPLKGGKYPASLGVESAHLAEGFAFLEQVVLDENNSFENLHAGLKKVINLDNVRLVQPVPDRFLKGVKPGFNHFAVYIRYEIPKPTEKSKENAEKKKIMPKLAPMPSLKQDTPALRPPLLKIKP
jgi:hypothetical protein